MQAPPSITLTALFTAWALVCSGLASAADYESPPTLNAADLAPKDLLKGPNFKVDDQVTTDGFLTHYSIQSDFGHFTAIGPGTLATRVREIKALAALQHIEQDKQFKEGAAQATSELKQGLEHFIDQPEETIKGIPEGIGRFFKRSYRSAKTGAQKLSDAYHDKAPAAGPGTQLPGGVASTAAPTDESIYSRAAKAAGSLTVDALGFDDDRRRLAKRLDVDPYTTNTVLAKKLDEVTWAAFAGNLGVDAVTAMIPGGLIVSSSQRFSNWVWDTPPGDLRVKIERELRGLGVAQGDIDLLLRHRWYPLSMQAALVGALKEMDGVSGRADIMPLVLTVGSVQQARFVVQTLRMLAQYHKTVKPLSQLEVVGTIIADAKDGELVVVAPVDYLSWNPTLARFYRNEGLEAEHFSVYLAGDITPLARREMEQQGWQVHANSALFAPIIAGDD